MIEHHEQSSAGEAGDRSDRSPLMTTVLTIGNVGLLASAISALWPVRYTFDLVANLAWQVLLVTTVVCIISLACRRFVASLPGCAACVVLAALILSQPRAACLDDAAAERTIRLLVFNMTVNNEETEAVVRLLRGSGADVVVLVETSTALRRMILDDVDALEGLPYRALPDHPRHAPVAILSRRPLETIPHLIEGDADHIRRVRVARVAHPETPFILFGVHPTSPRDVNRWRSGNLTMERVSAHVNRLQDQQPHPVLVAGDFNATPTGYRSRLLSRETGLRRARPFLLWKGTWPSNLPSVLRLPIDDVYVPEEVAVHEWRVTGSASSHHHAVVAEIVLP